MNTSIHRLGFAFAMLSAACLPLTVTEDAATPDIAPDATPDTALDATRSDALDATGAPDTSTPEASVVPDTPALEDTAPDAITDAVPAEDRPALADAPDTPPDTAVPDAATDATPDVAIDVRFDATPDVAIDAMPDVLRDATADLPLDATLDVALDVRPDAPLDASDAAVDLGPLDCSAGTRPVGDACVETPPEGPRLVWPSSFFRVTSHRPLLRWALPAGATGAHVQFCGDRACARVVQEFDAVGTSAQPPTALTRGVYWWRIFSRVGAVRGAIPSAVWSLVVWSRDVSVDTAWPVGDDFNGDGYADFALGTYHSGQYLIVYGGPGTSLRVDRPPTPPRAEYPLPLGDVNGDGFGDVFVGDTRGYGTDIHTGGPSGLSSTATFTVPLLSFRARADDDDGDGYADILQFFAEERSDGFQVFRGGPSGVASTPWRTRPFFTDRPGYGTPSFASGGDVNGDRYPDLIVNYYSIVYGSSGFPLLGHGVDAPAALASHVNPGSALGTAAYDVNGDGYTDGFGCRFFRDGDEPGRVTLNLGGPMPFITWAGEEWALPRPPIHSCPYGIGDVDGDGRDDYGGSIVVLSRDPSHPLTRPVELGYPAGDMNADGYDDMILITREMPTLRFIPGGPTGPGTAVSIPY